MHWQRRADFLLIVNQWFLVDDFNYALATQSWFLVDRKPKTNAVQTKQWQSPSRIHTALPWSCRD